MECSFSNVGYEITKLADNHTIKAQTDNSFRDTRNIMLGRQLGASAMAIGGVAGVGTSLLSRKADELLVSKVTKELVKDEAAKASSVIAEMLNQYGLSDILKNPESSIEVGRSAGSGQTSIYLDLDPRKPQRSVAKFAITDTGKFAPAHEVGHVVGEQRSLLHKWRGKLTRGQSRNLTQALSRANRAAYLAGIGGGLIAMSTDNEYAAPALVAAPFLPQLYNEARASAYGLNYLKKKHGLKSMLKGLVPATTAISTYAAMPLSLAIAFLAAGKLKKKIKHKPPVKKGDKK
ncbi:hypothetical protein LCGC14_0146880 [marine sediment metagenome]|uniref:Uncharacterized protein n=1 Tax=marine sediment metagenome TaxID=412755 RepID=A0A0F9XHL7_9ZZZZ